MVVTVDGNGTVTGSGVTGTLVAHNTYSTWTLNFPALNSAGILSAFTGTCDSAHILFGDGTCKALNSSLITSTFSGTCDATHYLTGGGTCAAISSGAVVGSFTGTCNSGTYLNGGGSCTAPIITAVQTSALTCPGNSGLCTGQLNFTGLSTGVAYGLHCYLQTSNVTSAGNVEMYLANGSGTWTTYGVSGTTVQGTYNSGGTVASGSIPVQPGAVTIDGTFTLNIGTIEVGVTNSQTGSSTTVAAGSYCTLVKP